MNRILMAGASAIMITSVAAGGLLLAGPASASTSRTSASTAAPASCRTTHHNYPFPSRPKAYQAGRAGSVTIAPVNSGTIKVASVQKAAGYRAFTDTGRGSSVDVYFRGHSRHVKFEAEINDSGGLTVTVSGCGTS